MNELSTENKIANIDERLDRIAETNEQLQSQVKQLIDVIKGNEEFGTKGYASRFSDIEQEQHDAAMERLEVDRRVDKIYYRVLGIATGVSVATVVFAWLFTNVVIEQNREIKPANIDPQTLIQPLLPESAITAPTLNEIKAPPLTEGTKNDPLTIPEIALDTTITEHK